jgi:hypothetical protein
MTHKLPYLKVECYMGEMEHYAGNPVKKRHGAQKTKSEMQIKGV